MDPKQNFHQHFVEREAALRDETAALASVSPGERRAAIDSVLGGIAQLQNEVADAAEYTPSYDRKQYSESLKVLQDTLNDTVARVTPKSRFQFRRTPKTAQSHSSSQENDPRRLPGRSREETPGAPTATMAKDEAEAPASSSKNYSEEMSRLPDKTVTRRPSFSAASQIAITNQTGLRIVLPEEAAQASSAASLTNLQGCVVDMSAATGGEKPALPGLAMRDISRSIVVAGRVSGAVHLTGIKNCVVAVAARQVRIHECRNVDVYLHCGSHPIIEDCAGMRFAPFPKHYITSAEEAIENQWDRVDDFKWLKVGHSPNWQILPEPDRLGDDVWATVVPGASVEEALKAAGIDGEQT